MKIVSEIFKCYSSVSFLQASSFAGKLGKNVCKVEKVNNML